MSRVRILMIDDNEDDGDLLALVIAEAKVNFEFSHMADPAGALARLKAEGNDIRLVLLDLKMPEQDGKAVLAEIRRTPSIRHLPVVVFSSSDASSDVRESYQLGANAYVKKPADLDGCRAFVRRLEEFWLGTATLP